MNSPITATDQPIPRPNVKFKSGMPEGLPSKTDIGKEIEPKFSVSFFHNKTDNRPSAREMTWKDFVNIFRKPSIRASKDGPLFSPARFTKPHRLNENVDQLSMLLLDFDHDIALIEALEICEGLKVNYLIYTTHSHRRVTKSHPVEEDCFRVIIPLKEPIPSMDFPYLFQWAEMIFDRKIDPSRKDLAGMFYLPAIASKDSPYEFYSKVDGGFLDWRESVGLTRGAAPLRSALPPHPPTDAEERDCVVLSPSPQQDPIEGAANINHTSTASVSATGVSNRKLPLSLDDISFDSLKDFEIWKAGLIIHISSHPSARLNRTGNVDAPGLCHESETGTAVFCDPHINAVTCNKRCPISRIAEAYGYILPPKSKENGERELNNNKSKVEEPVRAKPKTESQKTSGQGKQSKTRLFQVELLSNIEVKPISWLVKGLIPKGMLTLATGIEAVGKTTVLCDIAARVTKDGGKVLWLAAEDSPEQILKPRLVKAGADESLVLIVRETFGLNTDAGAAALRDLVERERPSLIVIDPITAFLNGDPNRPEIVRGTTNRLKNIAEEFESSILMVRHVGKSKGQGEPRAAGLYSIEWRAAVRSEILFGSDPNNPDVRALVQTKPSLIREDECKSVGYSIKDSDGVAVVKWTGDSGLTAENILSILPREDEDTKSERSDALNFLAAILRDGELSSTDIKEVMKREGITDRQLRRARERLGVEIRYEGQGKKQVTYWKLPDQDSNNVDSRFAQVCPDDSRFAHTPVGGHTSEVIEPKASCANNFPGMPPTATMGIPETLGGKPETDSEPVSNNSDPAPQTPELDEVSLEVQNILDGLEAINYPGDSFLDSLRRKDFYTPGDLRDLSIYRPQIEKHRRNGVSV